MWSLPLVYPVVLGMTVVIFRTGQLALIYAAYTIVAFLGLLLSGRSSFTRT